MKNAHTDITKVTAVTPAEEAAVAVDYPFYVSQPAAGFPAPGDDSVEEPLNLQDLLVDNPTATFFVRVAGDSMEGAKIFDGDVLVVDRSIDPKDGRIVVAAVYGELVVKRLKKGRQGFWLISEQEGYEPIPVDAEEGCTIWGVVTGSARVLE